jgi:uncharacterized protein YggE
MNRKLILILLSLPWASPLRAAEPELKGTPSELSAYLSTVPGVVQLNAEGEVRIQADRAVVMLAVTTENKSMGDAIKLNQELRGKVARFLNERGVKGEHIQSSRFSSFPRTGTWSSKVKSYRVENVLRVTAQDEAEFQIIASTPDNFPEVSYVGVTFDHSEMEAQRAQALAQACDNVLRRKKVLEEKFGLKLSPRQITEGRPAVAPVLLTAGLRERMADPTAPTALAATALPRGEEGFAGFGELIFKTTVTVEYTATNP